MPGDRDRREPPGTSCPDCVITVLPGGRAGIGAAERRALRVLAEALPFRKLVTFVTCAPRASA